MNDSPDGDAGPPPDAAAQATLEAAVRRAIPRLWTRAALLVVVAAATVVVVVVVVVAFGLPFGFLVAFLGPSLPLVARTLVAGRRLQKWLGGSPGWRILLATGDVDRRLGKGGRVVVREVDGRPTYLVRLPLPGISGAQLSSNDWTPVWVDERRGVYAIVREDRATLASEIRGLRSA